MRNLFELQSLEFDETIHPDTEEHIAQLRAKVPAPVLAHYDRLGDQGKKGVAVLRHQTCSGCHMRVPVAVVMELRHAEDVRLCDNCRRYLYLVEDTAPDSAPAPAETAPKKAPKTTTKTAPKSAPKSGGKKLALQEA
jgi:predicted  nucleic acid-binding Zn-ribbon protein